MDIKEIDLNFSTDRKWNGDPANIEESVVKWFKMPMSVSAVLF